MSKEHFWPDWLNLYFNKTNNDKHVSELYSSEGKCPSILLTKNKRPGNMITIDLRKKKHSIDELLTLARSEPLMIYDKDGKNYVLEETAEFENEVKELGSSEKFMKFLNERSKEKETIPISSITKKLGI